MRKLWSEEEINFLTELYEINGLSLIELYPLFKIKFDRTSEAINVKIGKLKLRHTKEQISEIKSRLNSGTKNGMYGKVSPIKGKTKETSEIIKNKSEKLSNTRIEMFKLGQLPMLDGINNPMYGCIAWNNGKTKFDDDRILKYGQKISIKAKKSWSLKSQEEKDIIINRLNKAMIQNRKPTKIEIKINDYLNDLSVEFIKNYRLNSFLMDFYLPNHNLVIECDGDYWHANPNKYFNKNLDAIQLKNIDRDKRKEKMLIENHIRFIRFWETDIHKNFDEVKKLILKKIKNGNKS